MSGGGSWIDELEARLERQLEAFLRSNPEQEAILAEQESRDRQRSLRRERLQLRQEAELQRQGLLRLAGEIRQWQERVERARRAGADDLAGRAERHMAGLMEQGRCRWQTLGELGQRFEAVERELAELGRPAAGAAGRERPRTAPAGAGAGAGTGTGTGTGGSELEADWAAFEAQQELQELKRRLQR